MLWTSTSDETAWVDRIRTYLCKNALARFDELGLALDDFKTFREEFCPKSFHPAAEFNDLDINVQGI
ncbi:hypothetical protein Tco_0115533 [Tanacetum coccineum]